MRNEDYPDLHTDLNVNGVIKHLVLQLKKQKKERKLMRVIR